MRFAVILGLAVVSVFAQKRSVTEAEVLRVHRSALLIDTHNDIPTEDAGKDRPLNAPFNISVPNPKSHTDLSRLRAGG